MILALTGRCSVFEQMKLYICIYMCLVLLLLSNLYTIYVLRKVLWHARVFPRVFGKTYYLLCYTIFLNLGVSTLKINCFSITYIHQLGPLMFCFVSPHDLDLRRTIPASRHSSIGILESSRCKTHPFVHSILYFLFSISN